MPPGYSLSWHPYMVLLFVIGNSLATVSYFAIATVLVILLMKRRDLVANWMILLFCCLFFICQWCFGYLLKIWTIWHPNFWIDAALEACAGVLWSVAAVLLLRTFPKLLALPSHAQMADVDQALKQQLALREKAEQKFSGLLEASPDAIVIVNQEGKIVLVNSQTEKLFGYDRRELFGHQMEMLIPTHFDGGQTKPRSGSLEEHGEQSIEGSQLYAARKNGTEFPVEISLSPVETSEGLLISSVIRDVTERIRAAQKFRHLLDSAPDATVIFDQSGKIVLVNRQLEQLFGYSREDVLGRPIELLIPEHNGALNHHQSTDDVPDSQGDGKDSRLESCGRRKNNSEFPVEVTFSPIQTGEGILISSAISDISQRMAVEERYRIMGEKVSQSNQELQQFTYIVSHDLQEPLRAISTFGDLLSSSCREKLDQQESEYLSIMLDSNQRMQQLMTDLLAYSRVELSGAKPAPVDATRVVEQALTNLHLAVEESGAPVIIGQLPEVLSDQVQLRQLFQNLIGNAIKYRSTKLPEVQVSCEQQDDQWLFSISDNGIGFDMKFADKIFEPFYRLHPSGKYPGTGIGLAICRKIVERLGGKIWGESKEGQDGGATFYFTVPATSREEL